MENSLTAGSRTLRCPFCEVYELDPSAPHAAQCPSCGVVDAEIVQALRQIAALPDALGRHACEECGHPEMRSLPDRVYWCPGCGSEVLPIPSSSTR